ncbi:hypothetical protein VPH46_07000 [Sphingomonas sp. MJ1 (PH-R8)]|uniref:hypothetical protein n=1 Tax=Sphingomonas sp. MJ1 (PH-R8) TaxID=3112950 RepID=UPI003A864E6A
MGITMTVQFNQIDFPAAQAPARGPAAALVAINQAFGSLPERTLDEVAAEPQQLDLAAWDTALATAEAAIAARNDGIARLSYVDGAGAELAGIYNDAVEAARELAVLTPPNANGLILMMRLVCEARAIDHSLPGFLCAEAIKRHAAAVLDDAVAPAPYMGGALAHWQRLYGHVLEDRQQLRAYEEGPYDAASRRFDTATDEDRAAADAALEAVEEEHGSFVDAYLDSRKRLYLAPAPGPTELAVKMKLMEDEEDWALTEVGVMMKCITSDARRFGRLGAFIQRDADLLSAFAVCRRGTMQWLAADLDLDEASSDEADAAIRAAEDRIFTARATTIEGVLAKLRLAFKGTVGCAWSDRAIVDPTHADFRAGLSSSDWYTRLVWGAIDDLAKLGGVDLATMGADPSHGQPASSAQARPAATVGPKPPVQLRPEAEGAGLRSILDERNTVLHQLGAPGLSDAESEVVGQDLMEVERRLIDTPAVTADDMMAKLLLIAQIAEEGHEAEEDLAAKVLAEARALGFAQASARGEAA